jgi:hypothetical protein
MYLEMNLFMKAPVRKIQGSMEHIARASRQFLTNAKAKPAKNALRELTTSATFSDIP